jgi:hypothetical protein
VDDRALKHYAQAIRSLAEAMDKPATDAVTLAALTLLQHDLMFRHTAAIDTHIEGIYTMIEKQGGLTYLDGTVGHIALFCDYQASVLLDRPPRYRQPSLPDAQPLNPPEITGGQAFQISKVWQFIDLRLRESIRDICLMVEILERTRRVPTTMGDYQFFSYKRNVIENNLGFMHADFSRTGTINECLCLGLILFQSMTIGGIDTVNGIFDHLIPKFKVAIGDAHLNMGNLWTTETDMAIWLMFIGACIPDPYKKFRNEFLEKLSKMLEARYGKELHKSKARVRSGLAKYMWSELMLSKRFNKTWKEIMSMTTQQDATVIESDDDEENDNDSQATIGEGDTTSLGFAMPAHPQLLRDESFFSGKGKGRDSGRPDPG